MSIFFYLQIFHKVFVKKILKKILETRLFFIPFALVFWIFFFHKNIMKIF